MKKICLAIVIVNYNGEKYLPACLSSIRALRTEKADVSVIIVDNNSQDSSITYLKQNEKDVILMENKDNLGFAAGNSMGMKKALDLKHDYVWLINNDTLLHRDALALLEVFGRSGVGLAGSKILFSRGREYHYDRYSDKERGKVIWYAGGVIDWANMYASHRGVDEVDRGQYDQVQETEFISGCSMMMSAETIKTVGFFDDRYFLYLEDLDYSMRVKKRGMECFYVPDSVLWHENAGSSGGPGNTLHEYYMTRNRLLFGYTYAPIRTRFALLRESAEFLLSGNPVRRKAVLDAYTYRFGKRYEIKPN